MNKPELSEQQSAVVAHTGPLYVRACPGSGKTRTLVARALRLASELPPARGLALLSFTNSATQEFKERLVKAGGIHLLKPPHFVGTIDSFLARFVVMPRGNPWAPSLPIQHVEDWRKHSVTVTIGTTANGKRNVREIPLSAFSVAALDVAERKLSVRLQADLLARAKGRGFASQITAHGSTLTKDAERLAKNRLHALLARGVVSSAEVRLLAAAFLLSDDGSSDAQNANLAERFPKLVVDETQDCNAMVVKLLRRLEKAGVEHTLIADPDQNIYTWRGADPAALAELSSSWGEQPPLTGNYRSSPNICRVSSSLKSVPAIDESKGPSASCSWPVLVTAIKSTEPSDVGRKFLAVLCDRGISTGDAVVLAPTWSLARAVAGATQVKPTGQLGTRLRACCQAARDRGDRESLRDVRALVDDFLVRRTTGTTHLLRDRTATEWMETEARRLTCEVLLADPAKGDWHARTLDLLDTLRLPPGVEAPTTTTRRCLPKPSKPLVPCTEPFGGLDYSTIHNAKGREYMAVLYAMGRKNDSRLCSLLEDWDSRREASEQRAVAYVGLTRAKRLLVVATPGKALEDTRRLLGRDGADVELLP